MNNTDLVDQLVERVQQLKEMMQIKADNFDLDAFLVQSIADHADEATLTSIIEDVERFIFKQDDEGLIEE